MTMDKPDFREHAREILAQMDDEERAAKSRRIARNLFSTRYWKEAASVFVFLSLRLEVDTTGIIEKACSAGKLVAIPRVEGAGILFHDCSHARQFRRSRIGILEPVKDTPIVNPGDLEMPLLVVTPGLAFDRSGHRLGRGRGFYDRFFACLRDDPDIRFSSVAICFFEQLFDSIPSVEHDQKVDCIVTDREIIP